MNIYEKKIYKFIVSNMKHIENKKKSYTALESKYSYRSSKIHRHMCVRKTEQKGFVFRADRDTQITQYMYLNRQKCEKVYDFHENFK